MASLAPTLLALALGGILGFALVRALALAICMVVFAIIGVALALAGGGWWFLLSGVLGPIVGLQLSYFAAAALAVMSEPAAAREAGLGAKPARVQEKDGAPA